jgi:hypothetical protein
MTITEITEDSVIHKLGDMVAEANPLSKPLFMSSGVPRSSGLHLSQIIQDLYYGDKPEEETPDYTRMCVGFAWEILLADALGRVFHQADLCDAGILLHPGEYERDGILMSPDATYLYDNVLEEYKATWTNSKKPIAEHPAWICQTKSYCYVLGMDTVRFRVLHIMGDYKGGGPIIKTWLVTYTQEEMERNWFVVKQHAIEKGWLQPKGGA